jgi:uncharacterized membrane protein YcaP (DUF421 family)
MTTLEVITTLCIGTLISHAISEEGLWKTVMTMALIVFILVAAQKIQYYVKWFEKLFIGNATVVIKDGQVLHDKLKKLRMTEGQLEMRLRQLGISSISLVKTATIEANGLLGHELYPHARAVTYGELMEVLKLIHPSIGLLQPQQPEPGNNLFDKVIHMPKK